MATSDLGELLTRVSALVSNVVGGAPSADPLSVERQNVALGLIVSAELFAKMQRAQASASNTEVWREWQRLLEAELANLGQLLNRMLQLAAAVNPPTGLNRRTDKWLAQQ